MVGDLAHPAEFVSRLYQWFQLKGCPQLSEADCGHEEKNPTVSAWN